MKKIISISGIDGAGKSTQKGFIKKKLRRENKKVFIFWSRIGYTSGFQFIKDILRLLFRNQLPKAGNTKKRKKALKNRIVSNLWIFLAIMDLFYYYVIFLRIKYYTGHNIILDRYLIDSEIDLNINSYFSSDLLSLGTIAIIELGISNPIIEVNKDAENRTCDQKPISL